MSSVPPSKIGGFSYDSDLWECITEVKICCFSWLVQNFVEIELKKQETLLKFLPLRIQRRDLSLRTSRWEEKEEVSDDASLNYFSTKNGKRRLVKLKNKIERFCCIYKRINLFFSFDADEKARGWELSVRILIKKFEVLNLRRSWRKRAYYVFKEDSPCSSQKLLNRSRTSVKFEEIFAHSR